jgi:hypothetical protein
MASRHPPAFRELLLITQTLTCQSAQSSESGGIRRNKIQEIVQDKGFRIAFCEGLFGNNIEIYDHSYEQTIISLS